MTGCRGPAFFLLSLGSLFAFASFDNLRGLAAPVEEEQVFDTLMQLQQNIDAAPEQDVVPADFMGSPEPVLGAAKEEQPEIEVENVLDPEEAAIDSRNDDTSDSRPLADRPRTTKHLYTTKRTAKGTAAGAGGVSGVKVFSLLAMLLTAVLVYAFRGKIFSPEEDEEHDDQDEQDDDGQRTELN